MKTAEEIDIEARKMLSQIRQIKAEANYKGAYGRRSVMHRGLNNIKIYELIIKIREIRKLRFN